jgi:hypothetical protein
MLIALAAGHVVAISALTTAEMASLLSRHVRNNSLALADAKALGRAFLHHPDDTWLDPR